MNLLIHDLSDAQWQRIADNYEGWTVVSDRGSIRPCIGCFRCWTSGTGECVFRDGYENMGALIHEADEMVIMSRYTYGGFSSFVKGVFDRCIGYVLPEFETVYGEMHHKKRYKEDKPVTFCFRGTDLTEEDKEKARRYVAAVCRNLRGSVKDVVFEDCIAEPDDHGMAAEHHAGRYAEAGDSPFDNKPDKDYGLLIVNCSLRGSRSNTGVFLSQLQMDIGSPPAAMSLSVGPDPAKTAEVMRRAETAVLGIPLYVDGLPANTIRLMETVKERGPGNLKKLYAVVNNGLYESQQNENLLSMIKEWCADLGITYMGAVAIGAGEMVGTVMHPGKRSLWPARNALRGLRQLAKAILQNQKTEDLYVDPYRLPRRLYILIANTNWQRLKRAAKKAR